MSDGSDEWEDYESGPYCLHWSDGCDEKCVSCGHECKRHGWGYDECDECACKEFKEP